MRGRAPVELLDIFPTLLELTALPARADLEGHSLVPLLRDAAAPREWPAITTHNQDNHTIRTERWRYIHYADGSRNSTTSRPIRTNGRTLPPPRKQAEVESYRYSASGCRKRTSQWRPAANRAC